MRDFRGLRSTFPKFGWQTGIFGTILFFVAVSIGMRGVDISRLFAAATSSFVGSPATLYMTPYEVQPFEVGAAKKIDVVVNARESINAIGTTITFPIDAIEILGFSKEKSLFDLWTEDTTIREDIGEIHFSGGTTVRGGIVGTGTILTIAVRAKKSGRAQLDFKNAEIYANDGAGTKLDSGTRSLALEILEPSRSVAASAPIVLEIETPRPRTPDVNTDGAVNLIDVSIMVMRLVMPYDFHFDLDMDGAISIGDVSVVLANVR